MDESIFFEKFRVKINEVDALDRIKVDCLVSNMQEAAWSNAGKLGFSTYDLLKNGITWVMNRMSLEIHALPCHMEDLTIETWPSGMDKYFVYRDYRAHDKNDKVIARATTNWVVFDIDSRKLIAVPEYIQRADLSVERGSMDRVSGKVGFDEKKIDAELPIRVSWLDLDINGHVNNSNYYRWIMRAIPARYHKEFSLNKMDIYFLSEAFAEEEVVVQTFEERTGLVKARVFNPATQKVHVTSEMTFNKN